MTAYATSPGKIRKVNQDYLLVDDQIGLYIIADGLGGHWGGEIASHLGVTVIHMDFLARLHAQEVHDIKKAIKESIDTAHKRIQDYASNRPGCEGMGTTVVLGLHYDGAMYIAHVGDSRAYLFNLNGLRQITEDHSFVAGLVRAGHISKEAAKIHQLKHVVEQCLGSAQYNRPDIRKFTLDHGDIVMLCSDGLTDMLDDEEIQGALKNRKKDLQGCADELIASANRKGGHDNISVILIGDH